MCCSHSLSLLLGVLFSPLWRGEWREWRAPRMPPPPHWLSFLWFCSGCSFVQEPVFLNPLWSRARLTLPVAVSLRGKWGSCSWFVYVCVCVCVCVPCRYALSRPSKPVFKQESFLQANLEVPCLCLLAPRKTAKMVRPAPAHQTRLKAPPIT